MLAFIAAGRRNPVAPILEKNFRLPCLRPAVNKDSYKFPLPHQQASPWAKSFAFKFTIRLLNIAVWVELPSATRTVLNEDLEKLVKLVIEAAAAHDSQNCSAPLAYRCAHEFFSYGPASTGGTERPDRLYRVFRAVRARYPGP